MGKVYLPQHFSPLWILVLSTAHFPGELLLVFQYKVNGNLAIILPRVFDQIDLTQLLAQMYFHYCLINIVLQARGY